MDSCHFLMNNNNNNVIVIKIYGKLKTLSHDDTDMMIKQKEGRQKYDFATCQIFILVAVMKAALYMAREVRQVYSN